MTFRRLDQRAIARRRDGGPRAIGRDALSVEGYAVLRQMIWARALGLCEFTRAAEGPNTVLEFEHAVPRSHGGADSWENVWLASSKMHRAKEAPFALGRLVVTPLGDGRFRFQYVRADDAAAFERGDFTLLLAEKIGGQAPTDAERAILEVLV